MSKKPWRKRLGVLSASAVMLLSGVSAYALYELNKINTQEFANSVVVYKGQKIPLQEFYENVRYYKDRWLYIDKEKKAHNLMDLSDFVHKYNRSKGQEWRNNQKNRYLKKDTIFYLKTPQQQSKSGYCYYDKYHKKLPKMPALGHNYPGGTQITQFEPLEGKRDYAVDKFNDEYNATEAHEDQHNTNASPGDDLDNPTNIGQLGQSPELTVAELFWDEIIANIKQCLTQRYNYLRNGKDINRITSRFKKYKEAVSSGVLKPTEEEINEKEIDYIANTVFDAWMQDKFRLYYKKNIAKTKEMHKSQYSNINAVQRDTLKHMRVLADKMHIRDKKLNIDIDFYPYLFKREKEILIRILLSDYQEFNQLVETKKKEAMHLDELEQIRIQKGKQAYEDKIARNVKVAKVNKAIKETKDYAKERFAQIKRILPVIDR
ncbi:MAG: hypothetical protein IJ660_03995 [Alphaproteobacteria bacterium]|nr:hypothetical protein [Alphaproteobacteria bacterium]